MRSKRSHGTQAEGPNTEGGEASRARIEEGSHRVWLCAALGLADLVIRLQLAGLKSTVIVLFEAKIRASSLDSTAVAVTPSGETVTTKYGIHSAWLAAFTVMWPPTYKRT